MSSDEFDIIGVAEVECPHKVGLAYLCRNGYLNRLPCPCNDPSKILRTFVEVPKDAAGIDAFLEKS